MGALLKWLLSIPLAERANGSSGNELSRLVDELNRSRATTISGGNSSIDRPIGACLPTRRFRHCFGSWFGDRAASQGLSDAGRGQGLIGRRDTKLIASAVNRPSGRGVRREQVVGLLLRAGADREISSQLPPSARYAGCLHSPATGADSSHSSRCTLPAALAQLAERRQGLVLLTGPTGCGKTSTLAALLGLINIRRRDHIITIEDPVEYEHANHNSIVGGEEVGHDTPSFAQAVRAVLRQDPDVILVGEMRDAETMSAALTAAETGHLVLSSLHTNDTSQSISRILDIFPAGHQSQIRQQLSLALVAIVTQQLVPAADSAGRYPAVEIQLATTAIRNLIRTGQDHQIRSHISTGRAEGMMTMEQSLAELVGSGRILRDSAFSHCYNVAELRQYLKESPSQP